MWKRIDESQTLRRVIRNLSDSIARRHGSVPVLGLGLVVVGWLLLLLNVFVVVRWVEFIGVFLQGMGIIAALVGLLLAEPLGK